MEEELKKQPRVVKNLCGPCVFSVVHGSLWSASGSGPATSLFHRELYSALGDPDPLRALMLGAANVHSCLETLSRVSTVLFPSALPSGKNLNGVPLLQANAGKVVNDPVLKLQGAFVPQSAGGVDLFLNDSEPVVLARTVLLLVVASTPIFPAVEEGVPMDDALFFLNISSSLGLPSAHSQMLLKVLRVSCCCR